MEQSGESPQTSSGGRPPRKRTSNHRWSSEQSKSLVLFLVDQVHQGMKVPKSFKPTTFKAAAAYINRKFKLSLTDMHVKNHYRSLKSRLRDIRTARNASGAGWDETTNTITFEKETVDAYFQVLLCVQFAHSCVYTHCDILTPFYIGLP